MPNKCEAQGFIPSIPHSIKRYIDRINGKCSLQYFRYTWSLVRGSFGEFESTMPHPLKVLLASQGHQTATPWLFFQTEITKVRMNEWDQPTCL